MSLSTPTFVVQRRVNHRLTELQQGLADRSELVAARVLDLGRAGSMYFDEPLRPVARYSPVQPTPTWCGRAHLLTPRRRVVATVELEVSMWSPDASALEMRPVAAHPERWRSRRIRQYFELAHEGADATTRLLVRRAIDASTARRDANIAVPERRAVPVGSAH
ncbi:MAG TPA: hypothetical protein VIK61_09325 [Acidimicrobiia bacterium]